MNSFSFRVSSMHHSLYSYNEANNNTVNNSGLESIYTALTASQLQSCGSSAAASGTGPANTLAMGNRPALDVAALVDRAMSIDEHLQSMPMPMTGWNDHQFRSQEEVDMLSMGSANRSVLQQGPSMPCSLRNVIVSRCDGAVPSSSDTSSSSCSPSSTENHHHHQQQPPMKCSSELSIDSTVASILNHSLKTEASDADYSTDPGGSVTAHRMPMQPMPLALSAAYGGRCSDGSGASGAMSTTSGSSTPAPVRRSRSSHDGMLKCQFCPKKWADQSALHTHMADCRMVRGHECSQCGKRFKARGGLQQHLRIHSNDRPYACHFCAKRFTQKSHVDQHERIHTGAKPFSCQFCGRAFRQRSQQLGHEATHSNPLSANSQVVASSSSNQQHPSTTTSSPHVPQQQDMLRNEFQTPNGLMHELRTPSSSSSSALSTSNHLGLLSLGPVNPSCSNNAVSSLLALSQNPSPTPPPPPPPSTSLPSSHPNHFSASNQLHQAAVGLLNGLH